MVGKKGRRINRAPLIGSYAAAEVYLRLEEEKETGFAKQSWETRDVRSFSSK